MKKPLRALIVEDCEDHALLLLRELERGGYQVRHRRVGTAGAMRSALEEEVWDLVLADHQMPAFSAFGALEVLQKEGMDLPFIIVSDKIGEEAVVAAMKAGAHDCINKDSLFRLNPAIERELREAKVRRECRRSEERLRRVVEQAADAMFVHDLEGRFVDVNRQACESLGYTREELLGMSVSDVEVSFIPGSLASLWQEVSPGSPRMLDGIHRRKNGTTFPIEVRVGVFETEGSRLMLALVRDITERRRAEETYRSIFEHTVEGIYQTSLDGRLLTANPALARMFGYDSPEEMVKSTTDVGQLYADPVRRSEFVRRLQEQGAVSGFEDQRRRKDGSLVWISENARAIRGEGGELVGFEGTIEDITERKRKDDALRVLAEASVIISSSLDYRDALTNVTSLLVPDLADWCTIDMVADDGSLKRLAAAHENPEKTAWLCEPERNHRRGPEAARLLLQVIHTGKAVLYPEITDEVLEAIIQNPERLRIVREVVPASAMIIPLVARGQTLGAIMLVAAQSGRRYEPQDLRLVETLARRVALGVDNARLFGEARAEISRRQRTETALARSEERYRRFIEQSTEGIWRFELEESIPVDTPENEQLDRFYRSGYLAECNDAMARMYGFSGAEELVGARLGDLIPRSDPNNVEYLEAVIRSGYRLVDAESHEVDRHGHVRYFLNNLTGIVEDGSLVRAWGTQRDITDRRKMEKALRQSEVRYRTLVEQIPAVSFIKDAESNAPTYLSPQFEEVMGYAPEEYLDSPGLRAETTHPEDYGWILAEDRRTNETGEPLAVEYRRIRRDGRVIWVREEAVLVRDAEGRPLYWQGILTDVTERKEAERRLREAKEAEQSRIARDLHDTVLQDIAYAAQAIGIQKTTFGSEDARLDEIAETLKRAVESLRAAVFELRLQGDAEKTFAASLESLVHHNRRMARGSFTIGLTVEEGLPRRLSEPARIELTRIVQEALSNARKHSGADHIRVDLETEGEDLRMEVGDNGRGFDPESCTGGLGVSSMHSRARGLGGELKIESEVNKGTRIRFRAPVRRLTGG